MRYISSLLILFMVFSFRPEGGIYDISLSTIDGNKMELSQFKGKKLLFIVLPSTTEDTSINLRQLGQLQTKHQNSLAIIGIPVVDANFSKGNEFKLKQFYKEIIPHIVVAESMRVKKSGAQSSLFQWLTSREGNKHFEVSETTVGSKFFVDENGKLYAVISNRLKLNNPIIEKILSKRNERIEVQVD